MQRRISQATGPNWVLLPNSVGFIDPLHSTGIAHTLCGIERLIAILEQHWNHNKLESRLKQYEDTILSELALIDQLVGGCYDALSDFRLFTAFSMLYFAAATTYEHRRVESRLKDASEFLCADDPGFREAVDSVSKRLQRLMIDGETDSSSVAEFEQFVAESIEPFNIAGLCDPSVQNMYRYTAAVK